MKRLSLTIEQTERNRRQAEDDLAAVLGATLPSDGRGVLVGASGGVDSTVLLALCVAVLGNERVTALYVDHGVRGDGAENRVQLAQTAGKVGVRLVIEQARGQGDPTETRLRRRRMQAFARASRRADHAPVLLAHHLDDTRETVALNLLRGHRTPRGLAGIPALRPLSPHAAILRPFVTRRAARTRAALVTLGQQLGLDWRDDPTNADRSIPRNDVRAWLAGEGARCVERIDRIRAVSAARLERCVGEAARRLEAGLASEGHGARWFGALPADDDVLAEALRLLGWTLATPRRIDPRASVLAALRLAHARGQGLVECPGSPRPLSATLSARGLHLLGEPLACDGNVAARIARSLTRMSSYL